MPKRILDQQSSRLRFLLIRLLYILDFNCLLQESLPYKLSLLQILPSLLNDSRCSMLLIILIVSLLMSNQSIRYPLCLIFQFSIFWIDQQIAWLEETSTLKKSLNQLWLGLKRFSKPFLFAFKVKRHLVNQRQEEDLTIGWFASVCWDVFLQRSNYLLSVSMHWDLGKWDLFILQALKVLHCLFSQIKVRLFDKGGLSEERNHVFSYLCHVLFRSWPQHSSKRVFIVLFQVVLLMRAESWPVSNHDVCHFTLSLNNSY